MKVCPVCKREYPADRVVCAADGTVLVKKVIVAQATGLDPGEALAPLPIVGGPKDLPGDTDVTDVINLDVPTRRMESGSSPPPVAPLPPLGEARKILEDARQARSAKADPGDDLDEADTDVRVVEAASGLDMDGDEDDTDAGMDEADTGEFELQAAQRSLAALDLDEAGRAPGESESLAMAVTDLISTGKRLQEARRPVRREEPRARRAPPENPDHAEAVGTLSPSDSGGANEQEDPGDPPAKIVVDSEIEPTVTEVAVPLPPPRVPRHLGPKVIAGLVIVGAAIGVGVLIGRQTSTSDEQGLPGPDLRSPDLRSPDLRSPDLSSAHDAMMPGVDVGAPATPEVKVRRQPARVRVKRPRIKRRSSRRRSSRRVRPAAEPSPEPRPEPPPRPDGIMEDTVDPFK